MACRVLVAGVASKTASWARSICGQPGILPAAPHCDLGAVFTQARGSNPDVVVVVFSAAEANDAFRAVSQVMADWPTPVMILHDQRDEGEGSSRSPFHALSLGALDVVGVPVSPGAGFWSDLAKRIKLLAKVQVVRHLGLPERALARKPGGARDDLRRERGPGFPLVAIAASLGGPRALHAVLRALPQDFPAAICVCQHITEGFSASLARWLSSETGRVVEEATDDRPLCPGETLIAPAGLHLKVTSQGRAQLSKGARQMGFRPSCDVLLTSAAESFREQASGVVLTGMGRDGAEGLLEIRRRGGFTIAQDEGTSAVFGMPAAAIEIGAASQVLPLEKIAAALCERMSRL